MENSALPNARRSKSLITRKNYFLTYNGICLALWGIVTLRAIFLIPILLAHDHLYGLHEALNLLLTFTQSIAILEVLHSLVGIVRASPVTTAMQVASRLLLVWGVVGAFPEIVIRSKLFGTRTQHYAGENGGTHAYAGILLAWGITECIRYGFFVWKEGLGDGRVPKWLTWLRLDCLTRLKWFACRISTDIDQIQHLFRALSIGNFERVLADILRVGTCG
jgi:very-long-chain (3R)-3-hydroxyacyl-CoA dehydratase